MVPLEKLDAQNIDSQIQDWIFAVALRFKDFTFHASGHRVENCSSWYTFWMMRKMVPFLESFSYGISLFSNHPSLYPHFANCILTEVSGFACFVCVPRHMLCLIVFLSHRSSHNSLFSSHWMIDLNFVYVLLSKVFICCVILFHYVCFIAFSVR